MYEINVKYRYRHIDTTKLVTYKILLCFRYIDFGISCDSQAHCLILILDTNSQGEGVFTSALGVLAI